MNCKNCGFPYSTLNGELWCPYCTILTKITTLETQIANIKCTIEGYDFPKTHSELTRGTFEGVANLAQEIALLKHEQEKILLNIKKLFKL